MPPFDLPFLASYVLSYLSSGFIFLGVVVSVHALQNEGSCVDCGHVCLVDIVAGGLWLLVLAQYDEWECALRGGMVLRVFCSTCL